MSVSNMTPVCFEYVLRGQIQNTRFYIVHTSVRDKLM